MTIKILKLAANQWQPIETAPKNGTQIIVYDGEFVFPSMWKEPCEFRDYGEEGGWCEASYELGGMLYEGVDVCKFPPTHWMPLPPSPSDKGVE